MKHSQFAWQLHGWLLLCTGTAHYLSTGGTPRVLLSDDLGELHIPQPAPAQASAQAPAPAPRSNTDALSGPLGNQPIPLQALHSVVGDVSASSGVFHESETDADAEAEPIVAPEEKVGVEKVGQGGVNQPVSPTDRQANERVQAPQLVHELQLVQEPAFRSKALLIPAPSWASAVEESVELPAPKSLSHYLLILALILSCGFVSCWLYRKRRHNYRQLSAYESFIESKGIIPLSRRQMHSRAPPVGRFPMECFAIGRSTAVPVPTI